MAELNASLKAYLAESRNKNGSKNKSPTDSTTNGSLSNGLGTWAPKLPSFLGGQKDEEAQAENGSNGWFGQAQKDPCCPSLTRTQRIMGFMLCLCAGLFCFSLAAMYAPVMILKARKFSLLYTMGSLFFIGSFSLLWGPYNHMKHLLSSERLPFTTAYFGSMFATLYFAMVEQSTILTTVFAIIQIIALLWYVASYIPGGQTGLKFFTRLFSSAASKAVKSTIPV
ncbi:uncharacterized protein [Branchiostoma lanceolatum]|uniref:uncharacterized protein n=1 Tax=Branchiostoma lanceolatum TaxID=7740 RepID=UPI003455622B